MKYFELELDDVNYSDAPRLINWYGVQDVRLIKWENYHKWQQRLVYDVNPSEPIIFTDILSFPFLLVSPMIKNTIQLYGDKVVFKETILLSSEKEFEEVYYLPIMQESDQLHLSYVESWGNRNQQGKLPEWMKDRNIFWVRQKGKRHTIINLDLAESLLRRKAIGLHLKEVLVSEREI